MALPALPVLVAVGAIWGITNPFIKRASSAQGLQEKKAGSYGASLVQLVQVRLAWILTSVCSSQAHSRHRYT